MAATVVKMLGYLSNNGTNKPIHKAKEHIKYMQVNREHHRNNPDLFNQKDNNLNRKDFFKSMENMPDQGVIMHKLVLSLREDDRNNLNIDLKELTRDTMERFQLSADRRFEWVAAVHDDDGHPHVHIAIKGRDVEGRQVFFAQKNVKDLKRIAHQEKILQAERNPEVSRSTIEKSQRNAEREDKNERSGGRGTGDLLGKIQNLIKRNERKHETERSQEEREIEQSNREESR